MKHYVNIFDTKLWFIRNKIVQNILTCPPTTMTQILTTKSIIIQTDETDVNFICNILALPLAHLRIQSLQ